MFFKKEIKPEQIDKHLKHRLAANIGYSFSDMTYLGEYENAIDIIFNFIVDGKHNVDTVASPLLYLMRHSLELGLKHNIKYFEKYSERITSKNLKSSHNISKLLEEFRQHFDAMDKKYKLDQTIRDQFLALYTKAEQLVKNLGEEDASFRYVQDRNKNRIFKQAEQKDLLSMKSNYDETIKLLVHTADVVAQHTDYEDLMSIAPEFNGGTGKVYARFPSFQKNVMAVHISKQYESQGTFLWKGFEENTMIKLLEIKNECFLIPFTPKSK